MIPTSLSEKKLSLVAGADRASLSFFVELDNKLNITSRRIARTTICIDDRLSYEDADSVLYEDTEQQRIERQDVKQMLERRWNVAVHLEQQRLEQGAFSFNRKELYPQIDTQGRVSLQEVEEESPSRKLVGELMILANETAALFAAEHNLPLIFRAQLPPDVNLDQQGLDIPPGPARDFARRGFIKRSETGTTAAAHAGLGLKAYSQVTSPMRRMTDLINQRQLIAKLRGETLPYSHSSLGELLEELQQPLDEAGNLQRERNKYWLLKYIKQEKLETLTGTVVRLDGPKPLAHVDIMFYAMPFHVREGVQDRSKAYELGQEIELHIDQVDPRKEILRLRDRG